MALPLPVLVPDCWHRCVWTRLGEDAGSGLGLVLGRDVRLWDWPLLCDLDPAYWAPSVRLSVWVEWAASDLPDSSWGCSVVGGPLCPDSAVCTLLRTVTLRDPEGWDAGPVLLLLPFSPACCWGRGQFLHIRG